MPLAAATPTPVAPPENFPRHIAIIMDGNGRWAKSRNLPRLAGHKRGAEALRLILENCGKLGLQYLTIYAFSSENWNRPAAEVSDLMELLKYYLKYEISTIHKNGIRLKVIGDRSTLSEDIRSLIDDSEALTEHNSNLTLNVALSYGGRQELLRAMQRIHADVAAGKISAHQVNEETFSEYLDTANLPDPDLLIRTGGEQRLSNFLLWQSAYTELYFTPVLWPDFSVEHLKEAIKEFGRRERRYGTTNG